jgi:uncharacterized membrane protein (DUF106 family)
MSEIDPARLVALLQEIRDNQRLQIERQAEALTLQRQQFALVQHQQERMERIQDRAEAIQDKGAQLVAGSRRALAVVLPIILILVLYLSWLLLRR